MSRRLSVLVFGLTVMIMLPMGAAQTNGLEIQKKTAEPEPLRIGEYATIWFSVYNADDTAAENVTVSIEDQFPFSVKPDADRQWRFHEIDAGETYSFHTTVKVDSAALEGSEVLELWSSIGDTGNRRSHQISFPIRVADTSLIVQDVAFPETVEPNSQQTMAITVENLADTRFRNIDVSLQPPNGGEIAVMDSSRRRIPAMDGGEQATVSFTLGTSEQARDGVTAIPISLRYEDIRGQLLNTTESTGVMISGTPDLVLSRFQPDDPMIGKETRVLAEIENIGTAEADQIETMLSCDGATVQQDRAFVGSLDEDESFPTEFLIRPQNRSVICTTEFDSATLDQHEEAVRFSASPAARDRETVIAGAILIAVLVTGIVLWRR